MPRKRLTSFHRVLLLAAVLPLVSAIAIAAQCPGTSTWQNESGSYLYFDSISPDGKITGHYINNAAGYNCQGTPYPVVGWILPGTNTIAFTVQWSNQYENCAIVYLTNPSERGIMVLSDGRQGHVQRSSQPHLRRAQPAFLRP